MQYLINYLSENNLLTIEQFDFQTGHSTNLAAIQLADHITKEMDIGKVPVIVYIDPTGNFI